MSAAIPTDEPSSPPRQAWVHRWGEVLLIVLVFFTIAGDPPPAVNEPHYLCRLKHFWNPTWCQGDLFLDSTDTQVVFIWTFGWITRWLSLSATAWVGRILAWTLLAWAWQRLSWRLAPRTLAAVLSAALWVTLTNIAHLAGEWVVGGVEAKCFAYAFVLFALGDVVARKWNRAWLLLGAACAFHPLVGGWSALVCAGIWLVNDRRDVAIREMIPGAVGGALLALIGIVPAVALTWNEPAEIVAEANRIYVFERLPHHLALLHLPPEEVKTRLLRHGILIAVLWILSRAARHVPSAGLRRISHFGWGAALLALTGLMIELALWNQPILAAAVLKYYWFRLTDVAVPLAVALYAVAIIAAGIESRRLWSVCALTAALALVGWHLISISVTRYANPIPPADARMQDFAAWVDACDWIAANTPEDALFLTPRGAHSFKWRTGRPEVATRKDIPQDARSMVEWYRRLREIHGDDRDGSLTTMEPSDDPATARLRRMAEKYGVDYILAEQRRPLGLKVVYPNREHANEAYVVYRVDRNADDGE